MRDGKDGIYLGAPDSALLFEAYTQGLTLVTYDRRTIPLLLKKWAEAGTSYGGVIFVDVRTIVRSARGSLLRALLWVWQELGSLDWPDRALYLTRE